MNINSDIFQFLSSILIIFTNAEIRKFSIQNGYKISCQNEKPLFQTAIILIELHEKCIVFFCSAHNNTRVSIDFHLNKRPTRRCLIQYQVKSSDFLKKMFYKKI